ncbi:Phosphatidylinositol 4-kinase stt4 [Fusarium oxysporum f. sp. albedinis]|nr:Phosphatidylinositol 4-kinase stt4 [Fusarium oxysporum f. sp. albedinis]
MSCFDLPAFAFVASVLVITSQKQLIPHSLTGSEKRLFSLSRRRPCAGHGGLIEHTLFQHLHCATPDPRLGAFEVCLCLAVHLSMTLNIHVDWIELDP